MLKNTEDKEGKICAKCNQRKSVDKFYKNQHNNPETQCKKCRNEHREERHRYYKQQFIYKLSEHITIECVRCGYDKNFSALDFHHIKEKRYKVARVLRNLSEKSFSDGKVDDILYEIMVNCEILCANCHRVHHNKHIMKMKK
tara:strand:- start:187 stop:612 length:426 start_codon:yes stop_codon:yes gene_type:complete